MALTLSDVLQNVLGMLGRTETFTATGGSATTAANSKIGDRPETPPTDYAVGYSAFVIKDTGGVAPEGKFSIITGYDAGSYTYTFDTVTDAVAVGDEIMIADDLFPLRELIRAASRAIQRFDVPLTDVSLTTAAQQTEYSLPVAYKRELPISVAYQGRTGDTNDNQLVPVNPVKIIQTVAGTAATLIIPQLPSGRTLYVTGYTSHPALSAYNDVIREEIHPELAAAAVMYEVLMWYTSKIEGGNEFWAGQLQNAANWLIVMMAQHPIQAPKREANLLPDFGSGYDPGIPSPILT